MGIQGGNIVAYCFLVVRAVGIISCSPSKCGHTGCGRLHLLLMAKRVRFTEDVYNPDPGDYDHSSDDDDDLPVARRAPRSKRASATQLYNDCKLTRTCAQAPPDVVAKFEHNTLADKILKYGSAGVYLGGLGIGTTGGSGGKGGYSRLLPEVQPTGGSSISRFGYRPLPGGAEPNLPGTSPRPMAPLDAGVLFRPPEVLRPPEVAVRPSAPEDIPLVTLHPPPPEPSDALTTSFSVPEGSAADVTVGGGAFNPAVLPEGEGEEIELLTSSGPSVSQEATLHTSVLEGGGFKTSTPSSLGRMVTRLRGLWRLPKFSTRFLGGPARIPQSIFDNPAFEGLDIEAGPEHEVLNVLDLGQTIEFERPPPQHEGFDVRGLHRPSFNSPPGPHVRLQRLADIFGPSTRTGPKVGKALFYQDLSSVARPEVELELLPLAPPGRPPTDLTFRQTSNVDLGVGVNDEFWDVPLDDPPAPAAPATSWLDSILGPFQAPYESIPPAFRYMSTPDTGPSSSGAEGIAPVSARSITDSGYSSGSGGDIDISSFLDEDVTVEEGRNPSGPEDAAGAPKHTPAHVFPPGAGSRLAVLVGRGPDDPFLYLIRRCFLTGHGHCPMERLGNVPPTPS
ncbi:L2 [Hemidactylus frenatus papillomavirus]|uniref:L2 n=1 Tax=Hemidactylus frenatus papillomavirus TaxID=2588389 RepID=A0A5P1KKC4_9PAPI|nr:L2 [Hemidactylus frenatus papillomavirus]